MSRSLYPRVKFAHHPRSHDGWVQEHILVAERALGHYLPPKSQVHHWDGDGWNNTPTNLVICQDDAYHKLLHQRMRAFEACGNPSARRCSICHGYDRQDEFILRSKKRPRQSFHRSCRDAQNKAGSLRRHPPLSIGDTCKNGHLLTEDNVVRTRARGGVCCRKCYSDACKAGCKRFYSANTRRKKA